jgi:hypothetical protein
MAKKTISLFIPFLLLILAIAVVVYILPSGAVQSGCPGSQIYCPGVGCLSGQDKCFPGSKGGASKVFSKETFVNKTCPDGTRSDGPCLMEF